MPSERKRDWLHAPSLVLAYALPLPQGAEAEWIIEPSTQKKEQDLAIV